MSCIVDPPASTLRMIARLGVTSIQLMGHSSDKIALIERMANEGRIPVNVAAAVDKSSFLANNHKTLPRKGPVRVTALKLYADHLVDGGTAWRIPYTGPACTAKWSNFTFSFSAGEGGDGDIKEFSQRAKYAFYSVAELADWIERAEMDGLQLCIHATGDGAVRGILDAVELSYNRRGIPLPSQARHRIEHAELIHPTDAPRFGSLGVLASMSPGHAPNVVLQPITGWLQHVHPELWEERGFVWQNVIQWGGRIPFSTDFPVFQPAPLATLEAAITREPFSSKGFCHAFTLPSAVNNYTQESAYAEFEERNKGRILEGMSADFVVLSQNIFTNPIADTLRSTTVNMTVCSGRITHLQNITLSSVFIMFNIPYPPTKIGRRVDIAAKPELTIRCINSEQEFRHVALTLAKASLCNPGLEDWTLFPSVDSLGWFIGELPRDAPQQVPAWMWQQKCPSIAASISATVWNETFSYIGHDFCLKTHRGRGYEARLWRAAMTHILQETKSAESMCTAVDIDPEDEAELHSLGFYTLYSSIRMVGALQFSCIGKSTFLNDLGQQVPGSLLYTSNPDVDEQTLNMKDCCCFFQECTGVSNAPFVHLWFSQKHSLSCVCYSKNNVEILGMGVIRPSAGGFRIGPLFMREDALTTIQKTALLRATVLTLATQAVVNMQRTVETTDSVCCTAAIAIDVPQADAHSWVQETLTSLGFLPCWTSLRMATQKPTTVCQVKNVIGMTSWEIGP